MWGQCFAGKSILVTDDKKLFSICWQSYWLPWLVSCLSCRLLIRDCSVSTVSTVLSRTWRKSFAHRSNNAGSCQLCTVCHKSPAHNQLPAKKQQTWGISIDELFSARCAPSNLVWIGKDVLVAKRFNRAICWFCWELTIGKTNIWKLLEDWKREGGYLALFI